MGQAHISSREYTQLDASIAHQPKHVSLWSHSGSIHLELLPPCTPGMQGGDIQIPQHTKIVGKPWNQCMVPQPIGRPLLMQSLLHPQDEGVSNIRLCQAIPPTLPDPIPVNKGSFAWIDEQNGVNFGCHDTSKTTMCTHIGAKKIVRQGNTSWRIHLPYKPMPCMDPARRRWTTSAQRCTLNTTPTVHFTVFVSTTTGRECTPTSIECDLPVPVTPLQTPPKASPLNWYTTSPLQRCF